MPVDSFKYLPRLIGEFYKMTGYQCELPIPWTPMDRPLADCKFGLVTSGGLYHRGEDRPFDLKREREDPTWGDPSYRILPTDIPQEEVGVSHLHYNPQSVLKDINVLLPVNRFRRLAEEGVIRGRVDKAYSVMGFQGYPPDTEAWRETCGPRIAETLQGQGVDCVLLTTA